MQQSIINKRIRQKRKYAEWLLFPLAAFGAMHVCIDLFVIGYLLAQHWGL